MDSAELLAAYYRSPAVRARLVEYCGGSASDPTTFSALALAAYGGRAGRHEPEGAPVPSPVTAFERLLEEGADVCRSLEDRAGALVQLDVDYVNPSDPGEAYRAPYRCFGRLEPVYRAVREAFAAYGLDPLALITGRGYHFTIRAPVGSVFHSDLLAAGRPSDALEARYLRRLRLRPELPARGRAHDGAGRLLEHLAHEVLRRMRGRGDVPVTAADVAPPGGGPFVCLDLSAYADPVYARSARCAFSANQKPGQPPVPGAPPYVIVLPRRGQHLLELLEVREDAALAAAIAARERALIPEATEAPGWAEAYRRGPLGEFHRAFDRGPHLPRALWPYAYDRFDTGALPACVRLALERPNPHLLMPLYLRAVTLALWGLGWHPRSIAGLICARYRSDHRWSGMWKRYEPCARAQFYVRLFAGLAACGLERAEEFTCASQAARGGCPESGCGHDLGRLLAAALPLGALAGSGRDAVRPDG